MLSAVRGLEQWQVFIPAEVRRKLKLKRGDMITVVETDRGMVIKSLDEAAEDLLQDLRRQLDRRGVSLDALIKRSTREGADAASQEFNISDFEKETLLNALSMRAQAALARIRAKAERNGTSELTDKEIEAEIQAVRREKRNADRA